MKEDMIRAAPEVYDTCGAFLAFIKTKLDVVLFNAFPFNLLKGFVIGVVTLIIYKGIKPVLKGVR